MSIPILGGEGLGSAMATAGETNSAAWRKAIAEMLQLAKMPDVLLLLSSKAARSVRLGETGQWVVTKCGDGRYLQYYRACPLQRDLQDS